MARPEAVRISFLYSRSLNMEWGRTTATLTLISPSSLDREDPRLPSCRVVDEVLPRLKEGFNWPLDQTQAYKYKSSTVNIGFRNHLPSEGSRFLNPARPLKQGSGYSNQVVTGRAKRVCFCTIYVLTGVRQGGCGF